MQAIADLNAKEEQLLGIILANVVWHWVFSTSIQEQGLPCSWHFEQALTQHLQHANCQRSCRNGHVWTDLTAAIACNQDICSLYSDACLTCTPRRQQSSIDRGHAQHCANLQDAWRQVGASYPNCCCCMQVTSQLHPCMCQESAFLQVQSSKLDRLARG